MTSIEETTHRYPIRAHLPPPAAQSSRTLPVRRTGLDPGSDRAQSVMDSCAVFPLATHSQTPGLPYPLHSHTPTLPYPHTPIPPTLPYPTPNTQYLNLIPSSLRIPRRQQNLVKRNLPIADYQETAAHHVDVDFPSAFGKNMFPLGVFRLFVAMAGED